jgi:hypothetical protein
MATFLVDSGTTDGRVWRSWIDAGTTATTSAITYNGVWQTWVLGESNSITSSAASSNYNVPAWRAWTAADAVQEKLTAEEEAAREVRRAEQERRWAEQREKLRLEQDQRAAEWDKQRIIAQEARERAEALLLENLEPAEREEYCQQGQITVKTARGHECLLRKGGHTGVHLRNSDAPPPPSSVNGWGALGPFFCVYLPGVPEGDDLLARLLLLKHNEDLLWEKANGPKHIVMPDKYRLSQFGYTERIPV